MSNRDNAFQETNVYVLKLKHGKYYVGTADDVDRRFAQHCAGDGTGSEWTRRHEPIEIVHQQRGNRFFENMLVLQWMNRFGLDNVRGGTFSSVVLQQAQRDEITRQLNHAANRCLNCGSQNHWVSQCPVFSGSTEEQERGREYGRRRRMECTRCGRDSHTEEDCFAGSHLNGTFLLPVEAESEESSEGSDSGVVCARCGRENHDTSQCYARVDVEGQQLRSSARRPQEQRTRGCSRCGRDTHDTSHCYARFDVDGQPLCYSARPSQGQRTRGCSRCGCDSHTADRCYASTLSNGWPMSRDESSDESTDCSGASSC
jgi:GAG-polyprotein viral zinc-finger/GIY-YIG catalytic domain